MTRKNLLVFVGMLFIGAAIMWWAFRDVSWTQFTTIVGSANKAWLAVAVLAMLAYLFFEAVVVKLFIDSDTQKLSWKNAMRVPMVEQLGNGITPFAAGGQPMQLIALMQAGVEAGRASSILTMKFVIYQAMIVVNFFIAIAIGYPYIADRLQDWAVIIWIGFILHMIVIVGLLLVMYWPKLTRCVSHWIFRGLRGVFGSRMYQTETIMNEKIENFHSESQVLKQNKRAVFQASLVTIVQLGFYYLIPYFILLALGASHVNVVLVLALHILIVMVISLFPIPGGTGGAEVGFSVLFSQFLPDHAHLVIAMVIWRLITYYFGMFLGVFAFSMKVTPDFKIEK